MNYAKTNDSGLMKKLIIIMTVFVIICVVFLLFKYKYTVRNITVTGNKHYTEEEIKQIVTGGKYGNNSLYLIFKYKYGKKEEIPFIEKLDVKVDGPDSISIQVFEKALAGYVEYLGHYLYFDKDGIVVESSVKKMDGIPFVTGLSFDHVVLHDKLPIEDEKVFLRILNITQLLMKYQISTDRIFFDSNDEVTLYFDDVKIHIGTDDYIDEKINELSALLPKLQGYKGALHMENYTGESGNFTLDQKE